MYDLLIGYLLTYWRYLYNILQAQNLLIALILIAFADFFVGTFIGPQNNPQLIVQGFEGFSGKIVFMTLAMYGLMRRNLFCGTERNALNIQKQFHKFS